MQGWLMIHITGAVVTAFLVLLSSASLIKNLQNWYKPLIKYLRIVSLVQIVSGIGLTFTSETYSVLGFCARLGIYLSIVGAVYYNLLKRLKLHSDIPA